MAVSKRTGCVVFGSKFLQARRKESGLPQEFKNYIKFMESYLGVPISIISLGPDREATIER